MKIIEYLFIILLVKFFNQIIENVGISTKVSVVSFKYDIIQSKNTPKTFNYEVEYNKVNKRVLEANQNSFIHVQFQVKIFFLIVISIKKVEI